jgi:hypothetical protein
MVKKSKPTTRTGLEWSEKPTPMDLSPPQIMATLVGSGVGFVYLSYGRSEADWPLAASGLALMTSSFFFTSLLWIVVVGAAIAAAPFACRRPSRAALAIETKSRR